MLSDHVPPPPSSRFPRPDTCSQRTPVVPPTPAFPSHVPRDSAIAIQANRAVVNDIATAATIPYAKPKVLSFGTSNVCPLCGIKVAPMELGTISGPRGVRWHRACLRCGQGTASRGCKKQLDECATVMQGTPLCRLCAVSAHYATTCFSRLTWEAQRRRMERFAHCQDTPFR
jgi:hypothetical protein